MSHNDIIKLTCSSFFHSTILTVVTELGLLVFSTDTELQVECVLAVRAVAPSVVVE